MRRFKKGDLVYHELFEDDRGVVLEEVMHMDSSLYNYRVYWADRTESIEPHRDILLADLAETTNKKKQRGSRLSEQL